MMKEEYLSARKPNLSKPTQVTISIAHMRTLSSGFKTRAIKPVFSSHVFLVMCFLVILFYSIHVCGPDSAVGIATNYGLDGPGSNPGEWTLRPTFHHWSPQKQAAIIWIVAHLVAYRLQT